jgi:hypothetical protein
MKKLTGIEDRVRQVAWPVPPPALKERVLSLAVVLPQRITWSDRVWFSRTWRLCATAAVLTLVGLEYLSGPARSPDPLPTSMVLAEAQVIGATAGQLGVPPDVAALLARRTLSEALRPRAADREWRTVPAVAIEGDRR